MRERVEVGLLEDKGREEKDEEDAEMGVMQRREGKESRWEY